MPAVSVLRAANAAYLQSSSSLPVAVFVGGTSGIGQGMAEAFARHTKGNAHIVIIGRNKASAESIISKFPRGSSPDAKYEFIPCDATLMKNVDKTTNELKNRIAKINYLVLSPGFMTTKGRDETEEGIDRKMAVHYYARWKFVNDLIPLLSKAASEGEDAKVSSVLAPGHGGKVNLDDLGLKKTYSMSSAGTETVTYNDLMIESFFERYPSLTFIHEYPGFVRTAISANAHTLTARLSTTLAFGLLYPLTIAQDDCGEYMLYGMLKTAAKPGAWRITSNGEDLGKKKYYGSEEARKKLWDHTIEATQVNQN